MDLDTRIKIDLGELLSTGQITNALAVEKEFGVSSRAIPGYFAGDRYAKTVIVMLNPGIDAQKAVYDSIPKLAVYRFLGLQAFVNNLLDGSTNGGFYIGSVLDHFDLKTAAFLSAWPDTGIDFPNVFPNSLPDVKKAKIGDKEKVKEQATSIKIEANRNCLLQKLQLELLPYPSSGFGGVNVGNVHLLMPFIDTVLDEIFRIKRDYVIFASGVFEFIFNHYKGNYRICINSKNDKQSKQLKNKKGYCLPFIISNGKNKFKAIIAHSFSNQAYSKALNLMHQYGNFCYGEFQKFCQSNTCCPHVQNVSKNVSNQTTKTKQTKIN